MANRDILNQWIRNDSEMCDGGVLQVRVVAVPNAHDDCPGKDESEIDSSSNYRN